MGPLVERHYTPNTKERTTDNMSSVLAYIPAGKYKIMIHTAEVVGKASERALGIVNDKTIYYTFTGSNILLDHGLVQVGKAVTADNLDGFRMARLFANSLEAMSALETEVGLRN